MTCLCSDICATVSDSDPLFFFLWEKKAIVWKGNLASLGVLGTSWGGEWGTDADKALGLHMGALVQFLS